MLRFFSGYVWFKGEGGFPERLMSEAAELGLTVCDSYIENAVFYAACPAAQYRRLRPLSKRACIRLRIYRKQGMYFKLFPYRKRLGLPVGILLSVLLLFLLSGRIWVVTVDSATPVDESAVLAAVKTQGVYPGCRIQNVDMQLLRLHALSELENFVYVSVNPSGCVARVTVNPREQPPAVRDFHNNFSNLVASRDGRILATEVHSGKAAVQVGEGVTKGMLLVSGTVETPVGNLYLYRASGRIMAETTRELTVTVPLSETKTVDSTTTRFCPYLRFLKWDIPLFSTTPTDGVYREITYERLPTATDVTLPIGFIDRRFVKTEVITQTRTAEQATMLAQTQLSGAIKALEADGIAVKAELSRTTAVTDTGVSLTVCLRCEENIAEEKMLNFTDFSAEN